VAVKRRVAVVGGGVAGLTVARGLSSDGHAVTVFEKARGPGGRMSTRRREAGQFDHGAQYFTARSEAFRRQVSFWNSEGVVAKWAGPFGRWDQGQTVIEDGPEERWVGVPRMSALTRHLADGLDIQASTRIVSLAQVDDQWRLLDSSGKAYSGFDWVILTCPGPQAAALAPVGSRVHERAAQLSYSPCWAAMLHLAAGGQPDAVALHCQHAVVAWLAHDSSKPERATSNCWVAHATAEWSERHSEDSPDEVALELARAVEQMTGMAVLKAQAHRWLYALPIGTAGGAFVMETALGLALCGDALAGRRVESAWLSAVALLDAFRE